MKFAPRFLVMNKPPGITSHDVVAAVRAVTGIKKVGHTGTLDPFATGVLPLALGSATRLIQFLDESIKEYDATIRFGSATDTGDPTGRVVQEAPLPTVDEERVHQVFKRFLGESLQRPPPYSAVKYKGKPLYYYARKGLDVDVPARTITIHELELLHYDQETLRVLIRCSRGTYARVLAHEIAEALGSAGHLEKLERPRSGPFYLEDALDMPTLARLVAAEPVEQWQDVLVKRKDKSQERVPWRSRDVVHQAVQPWLKKPLDVLCELPLADVDLPRATRIRNGSELVLQPQGLAPGNRFLVVCGADLVAIAETTTRGPKVLKVVSA